MKHRSDPVEPKPFDFVPFAKPVQRPTVGHDRVYGAGYNTGVLSYQLVTLSYLFVAGGSFHLTGDPNEPVSRDFYRVDGRPAVPGSSLKGLARSVAEAISPSCVTISQLRLPQTGSKCTPSQACPACSMFGRMSRMSKLTFSDAGLAAGKLGWYRLPALYGPRAKQGKVYQENGQYKGRKFYFHGRAHEDTNQPPVEALPPKSRLRGQIQFENLTDAELGLLLIALGMDASFFLKLGGGKPVCLGTIQLQPGSISLVSANDFLQADPVTEAKTGEAMVEVFLEKIRAAYKTGYIKKEQLDKLREIWRYPNDRDCPTGTY